MSSISSMLVDPSQLTFAFGNLSSYTMLPSVATSEVYGDFSEPMTTFSQPCIVTDHTSISEMPLYQTLRSDEVIQPVLGASLPGVNKYSLEENSTTEIPQDIGGEGPN
jgi:hypothetical protein